MADLRLQIFLAGIDKATAPMRKVMGASRHLTGTLQKSQAALKALQQQQAQLHSLQQLKNRTDASRMALHAAAQQVRVLSTRMAAMEAPTKRANAALDKAKRAADKLKTAHHGNLRSLRDTRAALTAAGIGSRDFGTAQRRLQSEIATATTNITRQQARLDAWTASRERAGQIRQRAQGIHEAGSRLAQTGLGAYHGGRRALETGLHMLAPGISFDTSMSRVQALTRMEQDDLRLQQLRDDARKKGASTRFTAAQVAEGQSFLAMAGFTPEAILGAMPSMLNIAIAGDMELGDVSDIVSNISSAFQIDPGDMAAMNTLADQIVTGFTTANMNIPQLGETMKYFAPVANAVGMDTATAISMAGMLGNIGIQGSDAGTALRTMTSRLAALPSDARKELNTLGVTTMDEHGNMRNLVDVIAEIDAAFGAKGYGDAERVAGMKNIFGQRAFAGMDNMAKQMGSGGFQAYAQVVHESEGNAQKIANIMADNLRGDWLNLVSATEEVQIAFQDIINPTLRELTVSVTGLIGKMGGWIKAHPRLAKVLGLVALAVTGLMTVFGALAMTLGVGGMMFSHAYKVVALFANSGVLSLLKSGLMLVGKAVLWLGRALMMNPIGLAITAIAVAAYFIYKYWEPIKGFFARLWDGITAAFAWAVEFIKDKLGWTPLGMVLNNWEPISAFLSSLWDGILDGLRSAWDMIVGVLTGVWDVIAGIFTGDGDRIMDGLSGIWDSIQTFLSGWPAKMLDFGKAMLQGLINGIKGMAGAVGNAITGAVSGAVDTFKSFLGIKSPSRLFAGLGDFTMQGYARGLVRTQDEPLQAVMDMGQKLRTAAAGIAIGSAGLAAPAMALGVPEMPAPTASTSAPVMSPSAHRTAPAPAPAPMTVNITIHAPGGSAPDIAREVRRVLADVEHEQRARSRAWQHDYE